MRIAARLALLLAVVGVVIFGTAGFLQITAERRDLFQSFERDLRTLGTAVQVAVKNALRDRQTGDVQEVIDYLDGLDASVDVFVCGGNGDVIASSRSVDPGHVAFRKSLVRLPAGRAPVVRYDDPDVPAWAAFTASVPFGEGGGDAVLMILRPMNDVREDLARTSEQIVAAVVLYVFVVAAAGFALGAVSVSRPLAALVAAMRRVRAGELGAGLPERGRDEIGGVTAEFNAMIAELDRARTRLAAEQESRRALELGLQRVDKVATIGQLSAGLAHEIGSPLQVLGGRARALLERPHDAEQVRRVARILVEQTERITRIVERLLAFVRSRPRAASPVDLAATVRTVVELLEFLARKRGVELRISCEEGAPRVWADPDETQQIVLNLLNNALDATPAGGRISVAVRRSAIASSAGPDLPAVRIAVEDTGSGMSDGVRKELFQPFFTTRASRGGTGLGLAVTKGIVDGCGGRIAVTSTPGAGTTFTVDLPVDGAAAQRKTEEIAHA